MKIRKKDDKRVLKPRYTSPPPHTKRRGRKKSRKPRKASGITLFFIILVLVAFVVGAGIGISMALGEDEKEPHVENVTVEMTNNLSGKDNADFDDVMDRIDYNNETDIQEYNITYNNDLNY